MNRATRMRGSQQAAERESSSTVQQQMTRSQQSVMTGPVAILWDMENCPVPTEVKADDVAGNIRKALRFHPVIQGAVTLFSAYGDFNHFPRKVREGCQRTGVNLIDVPNGRKESSDKAILVDLFLFALDNAPPCTLFLISGDVDFASALHKLGQRGYTVVLAIPSGGAVSSALCSAGRFVWDWPTVARGGGLIPAKNFSFRSSVDERITEFTDMNASTWHPGPVYSHDEDSDLASDDQVAYDDEQIVWRSPQSSTHSSFSGRSIPFALYPPAPKEQPSSQTHGGRETVTAAKESVRVQSDPTGSGTVSKGSYKNVAATPIENLQVEKSLRDQLVRLVSLNGQKWMELSRVPVEYQKQFGNSLFVGDHGQSGTKLLNLLERFKEWIFTRGEGASKTLHLTRTGSRVAAKLKREANKNSRGPPKEEVEANLINLNLIDSINSTAKVRYTGVGDEDDETAGEEVIGGCATKGMQTLITEVPLVLLSDKKHPQRKSEGAERSSKELEDIHLPTYDWGFGSGGPGGSGDEKDNNLQEAKDVEIDESTVEQLVATKKGNNRIATARGWNILDTFRLEVEELLVSFACKIPMTSFVELYQQRYSKVLDYEKYGVKDLESLFWKVSDVVEITEMDVEDLQQIIVKVSDVTEVFLEDKKNKLKVLVARRSYDVGKGAEKRSTNSGGVRGL